jgi:hypothetical protein
MEFADALAAPASQIAVATQTQAGQESTRTPLPTLMDRATPTSTQHADPSGNQSNESFWVTMNFSSEEGIQRLRAILAQPKAADNLDGSEWEGFSD